MIIGVFLILMGIHNVLVFAEKSDNEYPFLNGKLDSQELNKRAFEALGKRSKTEKIVDDLTEKNMILKKMVKLLLKEIDNEHTNEKRGFEALGKRSSDEEDTKNYDQVYSLIKRGFESLGKR